MVWLVEIKAKRFYRDGSEELVVEPGPIPMQVEVCSGSEAKAIELLNQGKHDEARKLYAFKIATACLAKRCYRSRGYCLTCFFAPICGIWIDPRWFLKIPELGPALEEIAKNNRYIAEKLRKTTT